MVTHASSPKPAAKPSTTTVKATKEAKKEPTYVAVSADWNPDKISGAQGAAVAKALKAFKLPQTITDLAVKAKEFGLKTKENTKSSLEASTKYHLNKFVRDTKFVTKN